MSAHREPIAIVGIGCRLPGGEDPPSFWALLREGRHAIREVPAERWDAGALYDPDPRRPGRMVSRRGGFVDGVDGLDWRALRIPPREASYIDPQHRLLLEVAWEALEDAGLPLEAVAGTRAGVFVGVTWNDYQRLQARDWSRLDGYAASGTPMAFAANRISYTFDLRGPSVAMDATCSSSLATVHYACQSLWCGETTLALAGGVNLMLSPDSTIIMSKAGVLSAKGLCRALDAQADGFVRGEGAGLVVLKPCSALTASDRVYALIRGTQVSHNGRGPWIMAPSGAAQTQVIAEVCAQAAVSPADIDYVELHGTGFVQGDPVEMKALGAALGGPSRRRPCAVGSVKTNIGNLEAAAGIASLIKVSLALHHGEIPPTLHLDTVNPAIELDALGLAPQRALSLWPETSRPSLAGVTTTSFSGVNVHAVLEAAPAARSTAVRPGPYVLPLSGRSLQALQAMARRFAGWLRQLASQGRAHALHDVCYTAAARRSHHAHRVAVVGGSMLELAGALETWVADGAAAGPAAGTSDDAQARSLAARYMQGHAIDWQALYPDGRCMSLPTYAWQRERIWLDWLDAATISTPPEESRAAPPEERRAAPPAVPAMLERLRAAAPEQRRPLIATHVQDAIRDALGLGPHVVPRPGERLFDLGVNSVTAVALRGHFQDTLGCSLSPTLLFDHPTVEGLVEYLDHQLFPRPAHAATRDEVERRISELSESEAEALLLARLASLAREMP